MLNDHLKMLGMIMINSSAMKAPWQWYCFKTEILQIVGLNDSIHVSGGKLKALDRRRNLILDHIYIYI